MRPDRGAVADRGELADIIETYVDRIDGRVGVVVGFPRGPAAFDPVYRWNGDSRFASASVIKLPILYALYRRYDGRLIDLSQRRTIAPRNRVGGSGVFHLLSDTDLSIEDLAYAMIATSDNAATNELIDLLGMDYIESTVRDLGLWDTRLRRKMMATADDNELDVPTAVPEGEPSNTTSPDDCIRLLSDVLHRDSLSPEAYERMMEPLREQKRTMLFARYLDPGAELAHKTGRLSDAALDTGFIPAAEPDDSLVFAVFTDQLDDWGDGADAIAEIGDAVFLWFENYSEQVG